MASILDRYGIKEVADVTFYTIDSDGKRGAPALYLDTLKVSTIEQTAETADARGGKGNPKLITWDYGKEITVNIEDALFSSKSLAIMFGNGSVASKTGNDIVKTAVVRIDKDGKLPDTFVADVYDSTAGSKRVKVYMGSGSAGSDEVPFADSGITLKTLTAENGTVIDAALSTSDWSSTTAYTNYKNEKAFVTYTVKATTKTITVSGDSFPGTYYIVGDTYARSDIDGSDQFFQFIIPKAKVTSENTITLEAEGDPSTFSMNLTVLRPETGEMMQLVQYDLDAPTTNTP
jgi:hypothetical protein